MSERTSQTRSQHHDRAPSGPGENFDCYICPRGASGIAGNANAYVNKSRIHEAYGHVNKSPIQTATTVRPEQFAPLTAKGGPLHDRVHVAFPQCSDNELNDR
jgi:hypothetical protein